MKRKPSAETTAAWIRLVRIQTRVLGAVELDGTCSFLVAWLPAIELAWMGGLSHTEREAPDG